MFPYNKNLITNKTCLIESVLQKRLKVQYGISLFALTALFSSCTHYYYAPDSNVTPLFKQKDEVYLSGNMITGSYHSGVEFQGAYAFSDHWAVMTNVLAARAEENDDVSSKYYDAGNGTYYESAIGYFSPIGSSKWIFETFAGGGRGIVRNYSDISFVKNSFNKLFIQPDIGFRSRYFDFIYSFKFSTMNLKVKDVNISADDESAFADVDYLYKHKTSYLFEPAVSVQAGYEGFKIKFQLTESLNLNDRDFPQDNAIFAVGLNFRFPLKKK